MKSFLRLFVVSSILLAFFSGCSSVRQNIAYNPNAGNVDKLDRPVTAVVISLVDARKDTKTYPKQVIIQRSYGGNATYDINDRTVEDVFNDAVAAELQKYGVQVVRAEGVQGPLDRVSSDRIAKELKEKYPGVQAAFGGRITDFMASSRNVLLGHKVHVSAAMQFYVLDVATGELLWSDYKTEWDDRVASPDHNYMIEQLDQALANLMHRAVRENMSLRNLLVKISGR